MPSFKSTILALAASAPSTLRASPINSVPTTAKSLLTTRQAPEFITGDWTAFPPMTEWQEFSSLVELNRPSMLTAGSTTGDVDSISTAIQQVEETYQIDGRVILAMIMQESHGYVGAPTTYSHEGIATAGLMQCSGCTGYPNQTSLSQDQVTEMVVGGVEHYMLNYDNQGASGTEESYYPALREYNSGSVNLENLSDGLGATDEYVSDVSQRMTGYVN